MQKAFDTLLQTVVTAKSAAENGDNEAFRYECLCCGEEVFLAAQDSIYKAIHFRHKSGNNDKDCELYLGEGLIHTPHNRKNKQERVEFYYNNKCFRVGFNFSEEEISEYEKTGALLEIRDNRNSSPFFNTQIDHSTFSDGIQEQFVLDKYAVPFYISNTLSNKRREYYVFNYNVPSFFKILNSDPDDENFNAKLIRSKSIYTGVRYFIAWIGRNTAKIKLKDISDVLIEKEIEFTTFGRTTVWGLVVSFKDKSPMLDKILSDWGYNLDTSESVSLLWPPAYEKEGKLAVSSSEVYLYSSFSFQGLGNINTTDGCISKISENITKVSLCDSIHILKKNAELEIFKEPLSSTILSLEVKEEQTDLFCVPNKNTFFLYSELGATKLTEGQKVFLTPDTFVVEYIGNTVTQIIRFTEPMESTIEEKFFEIISNYWVIKEYQNIISPTSLPQIISQYLDYCKGTGCINAAVDKLITGEEK